MIYFSIAHQGFHLKLTQETSNYTCNLWDKEEILPCMYSLKTKKMCEVHWIKTRKQILQLIHIAPSSKSSLIIKWVMSQKKKKKNKTIDNIILDIWYILIAFFYYRNLIASIWFKFYAPKVKTYFKILYIYII